MTNGYLNPLVSTGIITLVLIFLLDACTECHRYSTNETETTHLKLLERLEQARPRNKTSLIALLNHIEVVCESLLNISEVNEAYCPYYFDRVICWKPALANTTASHDCPRYIDGMDKGVSVSVNCAADGTWRVFSTKEEFFIGLLSGGLAGVSSLTVVYPLDFMRTRMAVDNGKGVLDREFKTLSDCLKKIYTNNGIFGFYRGYTAGVTCYFVYRGCYFGFYEYAKRLFADNPKDLNIFLLFLIAEAVSITSQSVAYPLDTVRRHMMMQNAKGDRIYKNTLDCWRKIFKAEGVRGFYHGLGVNAFRSVGSALMLILYDKIINLFY